MMCEECYSENSRITPLLNPIQCLENHTQYVCGTCGRCICIEFDKKTHLQRWNFPFKNLETAKLYLRVADFITKKCCGIYEITNEKGRKSYKIFIDNYDLSIYLEKNKDKKCITMTSIFRNNIYKEFPNTKIKKLSNQEISNYLKER